MGGGKGNRKKVQLGIKPIGGDNVVKSRKMARRITSQFHVLQKQRQKILAMEKGQEQTRKLEELEEELKSLGGIDRYQQASVISTQHFKTSKWVIQALRRIGKLPSDSKPKTLEVGAINDQLCTSPLLDVRAIDINSQLPCIEERDFFTVEPEHSYDVVVCSMVINCVFHPFKRGEMLLRLLCQLKHDGVLFLILPTRCLITSQIRSQENFQSILESIGFELVEPAHNTPHLSFFVLKGRPEWIEIAQSHSLSAEGRATSSKQRTQKPTWVSLMKQYFTVALNGDSSFNEKVRSTLSPYCSKEELDDVSETEDFSVLFGPEFTKVKPASKAAKDR